MYEPDCDFAVPVSCPAPAAGSRAAGR